MSRNFATQCTLVMSLPDGITDQQAFELINKETMPFGVDFIWPINPVGGDKPVVLVRVLKATPQA